MFILHQKKEGILNTDNVKTLFIASISTDNCAIKANVMSPASLFEYTLGCYESAERAKEVLGDIFDAAFKNHTTYEMPEK